MDDGVALLKTVPKTQQLLLRGPTVTPAALLRFEAAGVLTNLLSLSIESKRLNNAALAVVGRCARLTSLKLNCIKLDSSGIPLIITNSLTSCDLRYS